MNLSSNHSNEVTSRKIDLDARRRLRRDRHLQRVQRVHQDAEQTLKDAELLNIESQGYLQTEPGEKPSYQLRQKDLLPYLDYGTQSKIVNLSLSHGPYRVKFTRNGRHILIGGHKGSLSVIDANQLSVLTELNVHETVRDITFCHDQTLWAAAQKKYLYLYDQTGLELHCLREHMLTYRMEFLPYHFLLTTIGEFGELRWLDVSTGLVAASYKTKQGSCDTMCQNPFNAAIVLGHNKGCVSYWIPNIGKPVLQFLAHKGKVTCLQHINQFNFATAGYDGYWKMWDTRCLKRPLNWQKYSGGIPKSITSSHTELLAVGCGRSVQIWKNTTMTKPELYMTHLKTSTQIESVAFRPYEDFLFLGHTTGIESVVIPGSCLSNFDSSVADPYETKAQRREKEIHALLEKLPPSMITFDPEHVGGLISDVQPINTHLINEGKDETTDEEADQNDSVKKQPSHSRSIKKTKRQGSKINKRDILVNKRRSEVLHKKLNEKETIKNHQQNNNALDRFRKRLKGVYTLKQ